MVKDKSPFTNLQSITVDEMPTFPVVEVEFDGLALVDVQVGEPHGGGEQYQQQQELELLPDLLHGEAQHPGSNILRWPPGRESKRVRMVARTAAVFCCVC